MSKIQVKVIGPANSGCTTVGLIIAEALEKAGFTDYNFITDSSQESLYDKEAQKRRVETVRKMNVEIEEVHTRKITF
jgi:hypothetical protein